MSDRTTLRDRARGALAGLAIGDAIGRPVEGMSAQQIQDQYGRVEGYLLDEPAGSDDTEYALLTARTLQRVGLTATRHDFARTWREDIVPQTERFVGAGFSEMAAIDNLRRGIDPPLSGDHTHAWSDGLAMRVAPLGVVANGDLELARHLAIEDGVVSHSGEGVHGGVVVAVAIAAAMAGAGAREAFDAGLKAIPADSWTARNLIDARALVDQHMPDSQLALALHDRLAVVDYHWADGAPEAVGIALAAVLAGGGDFSASMLFAVNMGRDADTNAAIAGAVAGAISGVSRIPAHWVSGLRAVEGSCIRTVAGVHPLDAADQLLDIMDRSAR